MNNSRFHLLTKASLISIYLVILAGGIVRMTGSGMGCPDWPKCFGQYIPPTSIDNLPVNYKSIYSDKRKEKIAKFSALLIKVGMPEKAHTLQNDKSLLIEQDFNATKTWTEYLNRLTGAIAGIFVFLTFIASFKFIGSNLSTILICFLQILLLGFQGWMGSIVVATNLMPWILTIHMLMAILIFMVQLIIIKHINRPSIIRVPNKFQILIILALLLSVIQIVLGTQVRQEIDHISSTLSRAEWIESLSSNFIFHRSFAWIVLLVNGTISYKLIHNRYGKLLAVILISEVISGIVMTHFNVPAIMQLTHLVLANILFGIQFWILLTSKAIMKTN